MTVYYEASADRAVSTLILTDMIGRVLERRVLTNGGVAGSHSTWVDLGAYPDGSYVVQVDGHSAIIVKD